MSTHALIGMILEDESIVSIYNHFDGYLEGLGNVLQENYNAAEKVLCLLLEGNVSSLGGTTEACEAVRRFGFDPLWTDGFEALGKEEQIRLKEELYSGQYSKFYKRDRGDLCEDAKHMSNLEEWISDGLEEYNYLFVDGQWHVLTCEDDYEFVEFGLDTLLRDKLKKLVG